MYIKGKIKDFFVDKNIFMSYFTSKYKQLNLYNYGKEDRLVGAILG